MPADYGFHIFHVMKHEPERMSTFDEARPELEQELRRQHTDERMRSIVAEARVRYNVEPQPRNLPFALRSP